MRSRIALRSGFTLIELLVALALMAIMALMSWQGIDAMARAQTQTRAHSHAVATLQTGLAQWVADLDAVVQFPQTQSLDWNGRALRLTRLSGTSLSDGTLVVAWASRIEDGQTHWLRWQSPLLRTRGDLQQAWAQAALWTQNPSDDHKKREVLVTAVDQWQVFYYRQNAWTSPLSSANTATSTATPSTSASSASTTATLPDAVRLILTLPAGAPVSGVITRDWVRPTWSVAKS